VSADGSVVVGTGGFPASPQTDFRSQAFRWTEAQGMISLGDLPGGVMRSEALDVSADGSVVVGWALTLRPDGQEVQNAFFWTEPTGMVDLRQALIAGGVLSLENSRLIEATGVSADGLTIVGTAFHNGQQQAFVATIPEPSTIVMAALAVAGGIGVYVRKVRRVWRPGKNLAQA
jgi:probable HAF family extracellular repeat protein